MDKRGSGVHSSVGQFQYCSAGAPLITGPPLLFLPQKRNTQYRCLRQGIYRRREDLCRGTRSSAPILYAVLIAVLGFSKAGKSYTILGEDGVIATVLGWLGASVRGGVSVKVDQVLNTTEAIGHFANPDDNTTYILTGIANDHTTPSTPANNSSSRAHVVVTFKTDTGLLGCVIDVAGAEESANRDF